MHTKLKLKIDLFTDDIPTMMDVKLLSYMVKITVLVKDERYEPCELLGEYIRFKGDKLYIKCIKNKKLGGLFDGGLILPHNDKLGYGLSKFFDTDKERHDYLKDLYNTLYDWCTCWWGFGNDSDNKIEVSDDGWTIVCKKSEEEFYGCPI